MGNGYTCIQKFWLSFLHSKQFCIVHQASSEKGVYRYFERKEFSPPTTPTPEAKIPNKVDKHTAWQGRQTHLWQIHNLLKVNWYIWIILPFFFKKKKKETTQLSSGLTGMWIPSQRQPILSFRWKMTTQAMRKWSEFDSSCVLTRSDLFPTDL